ncbi:MAG: hypothetical protein CVU05_01920 [Bacteroidetes bacterium HGW-Bacteroidetes-21]|jgi:2-polyprenyl-3-methyl-5-hydroxy-6-metoxy-1,4-benzoquinol methylase|nr:MAG: hypothetical protein CVU05_01920 [Bacteroidetes bacterium HGW-Bacteroidetes-21]
MNSYFYKQQKCILCGSANIFNIKGYESNHLVKCKKCDLIFVSRIPTNEELLNYYNNYAQTEEVYFSEITKRRYLVLLDEFQSYRKTNRILDIGCGKGYFLEIAKENGWEVYGTDISFSNAKNGLRRGINIINSELKNEMFVDSFFDVITSFEVIEHINNPQKEIGLIKKYLRKGGLFYCTTPNINSLARFWLKNSYSVFVYPEHLSFYSRKTLKRLLLDNKFISKGIQTTGFSLARMKSSKIINNKDISGVSSIDERTRSLFEKNLFLRGFKNFLNGILNITGTGITIKGYFIKS